MVTAVEPRYRAKRLGSLFARCPMCSGSTDVEFDTSTAYCGVCNQEWGLNLRPTKRGDEAVWRMRKALVEDLKMVEDDEL